MIRAVVFDMDGVVYLEGGLFGVWLSREFGIPHESVQEFFANDFQDCLVGKKDLKEALQPYLKKWNWTHGTDKLLEHWFNRGGVVEEVIDLVKKVKEQGVTTILCTNNEKYRVLHIKNKFSFDDIFDHVVASYDIGAKKPDKEIFDRVVEVANARKEEIVFCDDDEEHVEAARNYGMKVILFKDIEQLKQELEKLGINI